MSNLTQFLELFHPLPGNRYIQVTTEVDETTSALEALMQKVDGEFSIAYYGDEDENLVHRFVI